jgi:hypothetical protein
MVEQHLSTVRRASIIQAKTAKEPTEYGIEGTSNDILRGIRDVQWS